jgi:hypothetical protein
MLTTPAVNSIVARKSGPTPSSGPRSEREQAEVEHAERYRRERTGEHSRDVAPDPAAAARLGECHRPSPAEAGNHHGDHPERLELPPGVRGDLPRHPGRRVASSLGGHRLRDVVDENRGDQPECQPEQNRRLAKVEDHRPNLPACWWARRCDALTVR